MNFIKKNKLKLKIFNSYITSTVSITFILLLLGLFSLLLLNTREISIYAKENIVISVFLKPDIKPAEIQELQKSIENQNYCKETDFISKERAAEELKATFGDDLIDVLEYNPLPASINIKLNAKYSNTDSITIIEQKLLQTNFINDFFYQKSFVHQIDKNVKNISMLVSILSALLFLITVTLINNTVRLLIHSKRFTIKTMQLVGANKSFILKPFLINSIIHAVVTSLISIMILIGIILYFQNKLTDIMHIANIIPVFVIVFFTGNIITIGATYFSVLKYLNIRTENLY